MTTQVVTENTDGNRHNSADEYYSGTEDAYLSTLAPDTNNSGAGGLLRADVFGGGTKRQNTVLRFTIPSAPAGESLVSATVYIYQTYNGGTAGTVNIHATLEAWVEGEVTSNIYSTGNSWASQLAQTNGSDRVATPTDTLSIPSGYGTGNGSYVSFDVTDDIGTYNAWLLDPDDASDVSLNWSDSGHTDGQRPELVLVYEASGATITGSGAAASDSVSTSGTAERELPASGTPASDAADSSGAAEREHPGSGTPSAQAAAVAGTSERVLTCSGTLASAVSSVAGTATLQVKLLLTAAVGRELRDEEGAVVASLNGIIFEWYDKDTDTEGNPDVSGTFNTNASGEATVQLAGSSLTAGQYGLLVLTHPSDNTIRGVYRIPVT